MVAVALGAAVPAAPGRAAALGADSNGDGVYDDIEPLIAEIADRPGYAGAVKAYFGSLGVALRSDGAHNAAREGAEGMMFAIECLAHRAGGVGPEFERIFDAMHEVQGRVLRFGDRAAAYRRFDRAIGGEIFRGRKLDRLERSCREPTIRAWTRADSAD